MRTFHVRRRHNNNNRHSRNSAVLLFGSPSMPPTHTRTSKSSELTSIVVDSAAYFQPAASRFRLLRRQNPPRSFATTAATATMPSRALYHEMLPSLPPATSLSVVEACSDVCGTHETKGILLYITTHLLDLGTSSKLWNSNSSPSHTISLSFLYARLGADKPSPKPYTFNQHAAQKSSERRTFTTATNRPLEAFEDLYYALLAKTQDIWHALSVRINNGFATLDDTATSNIPITTPTTPDFDGQTKTLSMTIGEVSEHLARYWAILNEPSVIKALDSAIRRARIGTLHAQLDDDNLPPSPTLDRPFDADQIIKSLNSSTTSINVPGLAWIGGWAPSMIGAWLEEKYRTILKVEKEAEREAELNLRRWKEQKDRMELERQKSNVREYSRRLKNSVYKLGLSEQVGGLSGETWTVYG
jgi:hypothetical protein